MTLEKLCRNSLPILTVMFSNISLFILLLTLHFVDEIEFFYNILSRQIKLEVLTLGIGR